MLRNAWIIPAVPIASFFVILFVGKRLPKKGAEVGVAALFAVFVLSLMTAFAWVDREPTLSGSGHGEAASSLPADANVRSDGHAEAADDEVASEEHAAETDPEGGHEIEPVRAPVDRSWRWFTIGDIDVRAGTYVDGLSVALLIVVSVISLLVHIFSVAYMKGDPRYTHYFASLSLFTAGMLLLVVSRNTLQMLFGWELMGLTSFMLIGHWWEDKANSDAAMKAFLTTRTGDTGLLVGISILFFAAGGTFDVAATNDMALAGEIRSGFLLAAACSLLLAVIGKSAQFPLHTWLPDAMAGPTPVSALIHAATMVVAGVFLVARLYGVFWEAFSIEVGGVNPVALIGGITVIIAALLAFVQSDIKRVLAYSTVSQLGYMVMGLGVGAWVAAVFHLFTHAFFKGLLFLGAGSVSHSGSHHSFDMHAEMGGLRKFMPITFSTFVIGSLALAGIFPLAGFWSKDEILLAAGENGYEAFMYVGLVGAFMTAAYMTRCVYLTFFGEYRGHGHPHESPRTLTVPLVILAILSVGAGFLNATAFQIDKFQEWVQPLYVGEVTEHHAFSWTAAGISVLVAVTGIALMSLYYFAKVGPRGVTERNALARGGYAFLANRYYLDHLYTGGIIGSIKGPIATAAYWTNQNVLDGVVNAAGSGSRLLARFTYGVLDQRIVDGVVNGAGVTAGGSGGLLRKLQTGRVQDYAAALFAAASAFALALALGT